MSNKRKPQSADDIYDTNAEASPVVGVIPKNKKPPPKSKVTVVHKRKGLGLALLSKAQLMYFSVTGLIGEYLIYQNVSDPWQPHLMWVFGIVTAVVALPAFFHKRE